MGTTTHNYEFTPEELDELKENTDLEDSEEAMERWARHQYPIDTASYMVIGDVEVDEDGYGSIEVVER